MKNILLTSAGKRVSLLNSFKTELCKLFPEGKIIAVDANPLISAACRVADSFATVPRLDNSNYLTELIRLCHMFRIGLIIPTIDTELLLLAKNTDLFLSNGIETVISSKSFIEICMDKRKTHIFFENYGIQVAKEYDRTNYILPMFVKPLNGSRSLNTHIVKHEEDLNKELIEDEKLMFLEYLDNTLYDEYTCDLYFNRKGFLMCVVPRKRIEVRDGEVNKGITKKNKLVNFVNQHLNYIDGARGCITVQLFMHKYENSIIGIEINPRFGGGYPLSYYAGANYPQWILKEYLLNEEIMPFDAWEDNLLMLRYDKEILVHGFND